MAEQKKKIDVKSALIGVMIGGIVGMGMEAKFHLVAQLLDKVLGG